MLPLVLLASLAALAGSLGGLAYPDFFPAGCSRDYSPEDRHDCIKRNIHYVLPLLAQGDRIFGLPSIDPIMVEKIDTNFTKEFFHYHASLHNTKVYGGTGLRVRRIRSKFTVRDMHLELDVHIPKLCINGDIRNLDVTFGTVQFSGRGPYNVTLNGVDTTWKIYGKLMEKGGQKYIEIQRFIPDYHVSDMLIYAENLVDNKPKLSLLLLSFINQFWKRMFSGVKASIIPRLETTLKSYANHIFTNIPYFFLFPTESRILVYDS